MAKFVGTGELGEELPNPKAGVFKAGVEKPGLAGWVIMVITIQIVVTTMYYIPQYTYCIPQSKHAIHAIGILCAFTWGCGRLWEVEVEGHLGQGVDQHLPLLLLSLAVHHIPENFGV